MYKIKIVETPLTRVMDFDVTLFDHQRAICIFLVGIIKNTTTSWLRCEVNK